MLLTHRDRPYLFLLGFLLFSFYPDLFLVLKGPLIADHLEQHYPWAHYLAQALKNFRLPFWTSMIHCGFPIAAEGQIGIFYLPHLLFYFLFPFHFAYSYLFIFHLFLSGWGTFLYARSMGLSPKGAFFSAFLFVFGAGYGGAYYNLTSLKTLSWFPLTLYVWEKFLKFKSKQYLFYAAMCVWQMLMAGYLQVALFTLMNFLLYIGLRLGFLVCAEPKKERIKLTLPLLIGVLFILLLALLLSFPQLKMTYDLAMLSNRASPLEAYAYVGSMPPTALMTFFLPYTQGIFRGISLYAGVFSLFFALLPFAFKPLRQTALVKLWTLILILGILVAAGEWSPFYRGIIKITRFYSFRTPSKFIIYILFAYSLLAGLGLEKAFSLLSRRRLPHSVLLCARVSAYFIGFSFLGALGFYFYLRNHRVQVFEWGRMLVEKVIFGRPGHPHDMEIYLEKLNHYMDAMNEVLSPFQGWNLCQYLFLIISFSLLLHVIRAKRISKTWLFLTLSFLFSELYLYSFYDLRKDFGSYSILNKPSPILAKLLEEKSQGNLGRIFGIRGHEPDIPLIPNLNMIYGIEDIGAYSPLVTSRYYQTIGTLGNVNDSNGFTIPDASYVLKNLPLLAFLNVSHILSAKSLSDSRLELVGSDKSIFLYKLVNLNPAKAHFFRGAIPSDLFQVEPFNSEALITASDLKEESEAWNLEAGGSGIFVLTNLVYPGWKVTLNGKEAALTNAFGLFQAVHIPAPGKYKIEFSFNPFTRLSRK
ncbi:MAG: hypothetical protein HYZ85_02890 [Candidatus Omnitrophica bacterium]|nr:hypothetical protein [Candidatus Omnitrophota bacterium]